MTGTHDRQQLAEQLLTAVEAVLHPERADEELRQRVVVYIEAGQPRRKREIRHDVVGSSAAIDQAVKVLEEAGRIVRTPQGYRIPETGISAASAFEGRASSKARQEGPLATDEPDYAGGKCPTRHCLWSWRRPDGPWDCASCHPRVGELVPRRQR